MRNYPGGIDSTGNLNLRKEEVISAGELAIFLNRLSLSNFKGLYKSLIPNIMDNLEIINSIILKEGNNLNKEELIIYRNIKQIEYKAKNATQKILSDLLKEFLSKSFKINEFINNLDDLAFLKKDCFEKFLNNGNLSKKLAFEVYIIIANYIISYYLYLAKVGKYFTNIVESNNNFLEYKIQSKIYSLIEKNKENISEDEIRHLIILLFSIVIDLKSIDKNGLVDLLLNNIEKFRIKSPESVFKKLLKSSKYQSQYEKLGILPDQIGFLAIFKDENSIKIIAKALKNFKKTGKFNDRGVLTKQHGNKDTLENILPFVNTEFIGKLNGKELILGELSLRINPNVRIKEILNSKKSLQEKVFNLINQIDYLNHDIYKLSQDIKILRLFIDKEIITRNTNLDSAVKDYLDRQINNIKRKLYKEIEKLFIKNKKEYNENFLKGFIDLAINNVLVEKLDKVIMDIAWESVLEKIKQTDWYKKQKDEEKRKKLKILSNKFIKKLKNPDSNPLASYSNEINKIFNEFTRNYKQVKSQARFFKQVEKNIKTYENMLKLTSKKNNEILSNLSKG